MSERKEIKHVIGNSDVRVEVSSIGPTINIRIPSISMGMVLSKDNITNMINALTDIRRECYPDANVVGEKEIAAMVDEGGLHEKEEFEL